jgi:hypothetical protein
VQKTSKPEIKEDIEISGNKILQKKMQDCWTVWNELLESGQGKGWVIIKLGKFFQII